MNIYAFVFPIFITIPIAVMSKLVFWRVLENEK